MDRGQNKVEESLKNKENVRKWLKKNEGGTQTECRKILGLSAKTVRKHLLAILREQVQVLIFS